MTRNMGTADRLVRAFLVGPAALVAALAVGIGTLGGIVLVAVAAVMLATSAVGFCPLYALFGIHTVGRHRPARA
jgi:hypothetical protein